MHFILLLMMLLGANAALQNISIDERETGLSFQEYYTKAIILRFNDSKINITVATTASPTAATRIVTTAAATTREATTAPSTGTPNTPTTKSIRTTVVIASKKGGMNARTNGIMEDAWKRYEIAIKIGELERVARNGTTDAMVEMAAREIWERTGGRLVTDVAAIVGPKVGASFGRYLGGAIGIACGTFFPPLQIPLVIGGVFIGGNLGRALGFVGGQIAAGVVNSMIADKIISPHMKKELEAVLRKWLNDSAHSAEVKCRSDICGKGSAELKCKCKECWKGSEYSDTSGLSTCKHCAPGAIPTRCNRWSAANCGCQQCSRGYFGADGSSCTLCRKEMQYSDTTGLSACKKCTVGTFPYECSDNYGHCGCRSCPAGKIGTTKGQCIECKGTMEYNDAEGEAKCKNCTIGSIPYECRNNYGHCGCVKCSKGKIGTKDGQCRDCSGASEYSDGEGASKCKVCTRGSYTSTCGDNYGHCGCEKCPKGKYGTEDRACRLCISAMDYSDTEGLSSCKKCSVGSVPQGCRYGSGNCGCHKCSAGKFGTEKGFCEYCDGRMEYSDSEGSTFCKKCNLGSIPYECSYNSGHCGCKKCSKGKIGTDKGICKLCNGVMDYSDSEGSTSCKKCSLGSIPKECNWNYGNCECVKCSAGKYGTEKGICELCNGAMEYSNTTGSTSCKTCSLGSIPKNCGYNYGHCGCTQCSEGSYGTSKGKCLRCDGAMEYSDSKGATSCKICPAGTHAYRCQWHYGNCGCHKN